MLGSPAVRPLFDCVQILHATPLTYFWYNTMTYLDALTYTLFSEQISKTTGWITSILHIHDLKMIPSCAFSSYCTLTQMLSHPFWPNLKAHNMLTLSAIQLSTEHRNSVTFKC